MSFKMLQISVFSLFLGAHRDSVDGELHSRGKPGGLLLQESCLLFPRDGTHRNPTTGKDTPTF